MKSLIANVDNRRVIIAGSMLGMTDEQVEMVRTTPMTTEQYSELYAKIKWHADRLAEITPVGLC